jgi:flavin-dependent dehydrogenase
MRSASDTTAEGRALLVGDAAGLIDPLTGDGMYEAFVSARLAAEAVLDLLAGRARDLEPYAGRLDRELRAITAACWGAKHAFDRFPRLSFTITRFPKSWDAFQRVTRGEAAYPGTIHGLARVPLRVVDGLARVSGDPGRAYRAPSPG